jgi:hypothetical protein
MFPDELQQLRRSTWHVAANPLATLDDARAFIDAVGMCLLYPVRPALLLPTFVGAVAGDDARLPTPKQAFSDARAERANELVVRLNEQQLVFPSNLFADNLLLLSPRVFPYFYALVGERSPRRETSSRVTQLALAEIEQHGPIGETKLRERVGAGLSAEALGRALGELWMRLRILPASENPREGRLWDSVARRAPAAVRQAAQLSAAAALSALISQYLAAVVAAEQSEVEELFSHLAARSKVREALNALLAARELSFVNVGHRSLVQLTPEPEPRGPRPRPERPMSPPSAPAARPERRFGKPRSRRNTKPPFRRKPA